MSEETRDKTIWRIVHETPALEVRAAIRPPGGEPPAVSPIDAMLGSDELLREFARRRRLCGHEDDRECGGIALLAPDEIADLVWRQVFLDHSPLSEAARVVLTTLGLFGFDVGSRDLRRYREGFSAMPPAERMERALTIANLRVVLYSVDCFAALESAPPNAWPARFKPVLSMDGVFADWKNSAKILRKLGFGVKTKIDGFALLEMRRFLEEGIKKLQPCAVRVDFPRVAERGPATIIHEAVLPLCREHGMAVMTAVDDSERFSGGESYAPAWDAYPDVNFLVFPASSAGLADLCRMAARCCNVLLCGPDPESAAPARFADYTAGRLATLGGAFHAYYSGATVLEELAGRWAHCRWQLGEALVKRYDELARTGWRFDENNARADIEAMLYGNAARFLGL